MIMNNIISLLQRCSDDGASVGLRWMDVDVGSGALFVMIVSHQNNKKEISMDG